jgi:hypothetical protein
MHRKQHPLPPTTVTRGSELFFSKAGSFDMMKTSQDHKAMCLGG